ncbi:hypothetical protein BS50DRAFT_636270 [Corynespora cassiicola Philippines]|uniref:BTB domain-containing protein n=1 Tax=Corynespora cassiicola Philippines TaxID=1448308 RepID=A0A2T2NJ86_CORCC|nr:hypothetical protein BS50DRAFT_636270 [Corynespora cassiicola Philippines]
MNNNNPPTLLESAQAKTGSMFMTELIEVFVGSGASQRLFKVHKGLITTRSKFFANALKAGRFKESEQNRVAFLSDAEDPDIFELYLCCLYDPDLLNLYDYWTPSAGFTSDGIAFERDRFQSDVANSEYESYEEDLRRIIDLYVLINRLQDEKMKLSTAKHFHRWMLSGLDFTGLGPTQARRLPPVECINALYDGTLSPDPARRSIVQVFSQYASVDNGKEILMCPELHKDFLQELLLSIMDYRDPHRGFRPV